MLFNFENYISCILLKTKTKAIPQIFYRPCLYCNTASCSGLRSWVLHVLKKGLHVPWSPLELPKAKAAPLSFQPSAQQSVDSATYSLTFSLRCWAPAKTRFFTKSNPKSPASPPHQIQPTDFAGFIKLKELPVGETYTQTLKPQGIFGCYCPPREQKGWETLQTGNSLQMCTSALRDTWRPEGFRSWGRVFMCCLETRDQIGTGSPRRERLKYFSIISRVEGCSSSGPEGSSGPYFSSASDCRNSWHLMDPQS